MAQLFRLSRCSRNVGVESPDWKDYVTATSSPFRFLSSRESGLRNECHSLRFASSVRGQQASVCYSSGITKTAPLKDENLGQSLWKKKKKKNSVVCEKVHGELFSVLNRRAVQLVFSRENKLMQRTLVTNFSFMDFPLHESAEAFNTRMAELSLQKMFERVPSDKDKMFERVPSDKDKMFERVPSDKDKMFERVPSDKDKLFERVPSDKDKIFEHVRLDKDSALSLQVSNMSWQSQLSSFDKQLDEFVLSGKPRNHSIVIDDSHLFGNEQVVSTGSALDSHLFGNEQAVSTGSANKDNLNLPTAGDFSQSAPQKAAAWPQVSDTEISNHRSQVSYGAVDLEKKSFKQYLIPGREKTLPLPKLTVKKVAVASKPESKNMQKKAVVQSHDGGLSVQRDGIYEDVLEHDQEDEAGPDLHEFLAENSLLYPESGFFSKLDMRRLKKLKAKQEKFQSDPAKFNHLYNQELLAFVEACCFAGMEKLAFQTIKVNQHYRLVPDSDLPSGMHQIHDINIFNRLMQTLARKCQLGHIKDLLRILADNGLRPNMQTYAAVWECLGRDDAVDLAEGHRLLRQMETEGLDIKELFNKSVFVKDEQEFILKAILAVDPSYKANSPTLPEPPKGPLIDSLKMPVDQVVEKNPYAGIMSREEVKKLMETQIQRELRSSITIKSIVKHSAPGHRTLQHRKKLEKVKEEWRSLLTKAFEKKLRFMARKNREEEYGLSVYPYLKLFDPQDYVRCLLQEVEELALSSESYSPAKLVLWKRVSERIYTKYVITDKIRNEVPRKVSILYDQYLERYLDPDLDLTSHRQIWQQLLQQHPQGPSLDGPEKVWPEHVYLALGKLLYEIIFFDLKIDSNLFKSSSSTKNLVPTFYTIYRHYANQVVEEIKPHPVLVKLYKGADLEELTFDASFLPMLVPPLPWLSPMHGGYLFTSVGLVRLSSQSQRQAQRLHEMPSSQLATVLDSINTLSACAWVINKSVLNIIIDMFNNNGNAALDIPPPASQCPSPPKITSDMTAQQRSQAHRQRLKLKVQKAEMYSLWCQELYKLSIASKFSDDVFWFPHNLDFRGRTYPCPPHFNHLGSDVTRSILMFAKGKPLGEKGLDWMKIHLINLTGFKKRCPNRERLAYANEMLPEILDSADNPMTGNKWWQKSDEPWQTLACCMEIAKAVRSPNHTEYVCHLPIHQDGSCNGLQHYAALGRDQAGAESVNLWPYDRPQDVYSAVCELVEKERLKDEAEGVEIARHLNGFVRRKVIKQTVMTTVYGVTRYGAKFQILRQLKDIPDFPREHAWQGSIYLTEKTFLCLHEMFSSTKDIQDWLTLSAQLIATVCQQPVQWDTPVGLTVVQPYHKPVTLKRLGVTTSSTRIQFQKPNAMKQKNAFPPNFIHSLDSTHMMLTSLHCMKAGITFVSVHDCFWTHACDVEIMNQVCRQQFVALHKHPILEDLSRQLINLYTPDEASLEKMEPAEKKARQFLRNVLGNVPRRGDFDLEKVLESTYFFS